MDIYPAVPKPRTVEANKPPLAEKVETKDAVDIYPAVPKPVTVEARDVFRKVVDTLFRRLGEETNPAV